MPLRCSFSRKATTSKDANREPCLCLGEAEFVADKVETVGRIGGVKDCERVIEADAVGMLAQQSVADRMKGAGPGDLAGRPGHA